MQRNSGLLKLPVLSMFTMKSNHQREKEDFFKVMNNNLKSMDASRLGLLTYRGVKISKYSFLMP